VVASYLSHSWSLKAADGDAGMMGDRPSIFLIHRSVADQLLEGTGKSLKELQLEIDRSLEPQSFVLEDKTIQIDLHMEVADLEVSNIFGLIKGSDPVLKDEVVIYVAHYDHLGTDGEGGIFNGADDNASGTVALIELAEAFMKEKKHPARSIGILWVSAEEIGLFGSEYFADHPLIPTEKTAAVINMDMVGHRKTAKDVKSGRQDLTIVDGDTVKVIGGLQSTVLMQINKETLEEMGMVGNYTYNDPNHPQQYFYRSDHISFARKDIPVLFYSTGTHMDYHTLTDVEERIDYDKFLKMARFCFKVGYNVAQYKGPITVDNPMSGW
jgi:Zn-dependent M28 family amino/carboxypeptidase